MTVKVYDKKGAPQSWAWLVREFGPLEHLVAPAGPAYRLAGLYEVDDLDDDTQRIAPEVAATIIARVFNADGSKAVGVDVAWYWPDAPTDADAGPLGGVLPHMQPGRCVHGVTGANGDVGFGMGQGAYYRPDWGAIGPHAIWMYGADTPSDIILGLGMEAGTNHRHLDTVWMWCGDEPPPPPPPPDKGVRYFDVSGEERDAAWALTYFGPQNIHEPVSDNAYRLIELRADNDE